MNAGLLVDHLPSRVAVPARARFGEQDRELRLLPSFVERGSTVVDAGAHKGAYTWHLARLVGSSGCVHAFEPQPDLAARLVSWAPRHVTVHQQGLSDDTGTARLTVPVWGDRRMQGHASLESSRPDVDPAVQQVDVVRLDDLDLQPSFLKIDVEGHEAALLRGGARTVEQHRPVLLLEIDYRHHYEAVQRGALLRWLRDHDYSAHFVTGSTLTELGELDPETDPNDALALDHYVFNWFLLPADAGQRQ